MWSVAEGSVGNGWSGADVLSQPNLQEAKQEPYDGAYRQCACRHGNTTAEQVTEEEALHPSGDLLRGGSGGSDTTAKGMRSFWRHFLGSAEVLAQHCLLRRTPKGTFFNRSTPWCTQQTVGTSRKRRERKRQRTNFATHAQLSPITRHKSKNTWRTKHQKAQPADTTNSNEWIVVKKNKLNYEKMFPAPKEWSSGDIISDTLPLERAGEPATSAEQPQATKKQLTTTNSTNTISGILRCGIVR